MHHVYSHQLSSVTFAIIIFCLSHYTKAPHSLKSHCFAFMSLIDVCIQCIVYAAKAINVQQKTKTDHQLDAMFSIMHSQH